MHAKYSPLTNPRANEKEVKLKKIIKLTRKQIKKSKCNGTNNKVKQTKVPTNLKFNHLLHKQKVICKQIINSSHNEMKQ
jgi:hypothetical protein